MTDLRGLVDLAAERVGGRALLANDEFFAPKENLLHPGRGEFIEGKYTDRGKWMDGWETRRRREPGFDWCVVRLGIPGVVRAVTVDTNHFRGNYPESCSLDAAALAADPDAAMADRRGAPWIELLPRTPLAGHTEQVFPVRADARVTHVRLNIHPDGGVARLRVWGEARPDWAAIAARGGEGPVDLAAVELGGAPLASSDAFFGQPVNLLLPDRPANMGDGWETKRRRGPGYDWVIVRLGHRGVPQEVEIDTTHFKGNYPDAASLEGCDAPALDPRAVPGADAGWRELLPRAKLGPDTRHRFPLPSGTTATHVRLNIFPDGGVARLRVVGRVV
jgi:allantoicase